MYIFKKILLIVVLMSFFVGFLVRPSFSWETIDYVTHYGYTSETLTFMWDAGVGATSYEYRLYHVERKVYGDVVETTALQAEVQLPRTGHYIVEVRSKNERGCSVWVQSTDAEKSTVDGQPRAWWVYGCVKPPGPIIIN